MIRWLCVLLALIIYPAPAAAQDQPYPYCAQELNAVWLNTDNVRTLCATIANGQEYVDNAGTLFRAQLIDGRGFGPGAARTGEQLFKQCIDALEPETPLTDVSAITTCSQAVDTVLVEGWVEHVTNSLIDQLQARGMEPLEVSTAADLLQRCLNDSLSDSRADIATTGNACGEAITAQLNSDVKRVVVGILSATCFRRPSGGYEQVAASVRIAQDAPDPQDTLTVCWADDQTAAPPPPAPPPVVTAVTWKRSTLQVNPDNKPTDYTALGFPGVNWKSGSNDSIVWTYKSPVHDFEFAFTFTAPPEQIRADQPLQVTLHGTGKVNQNDGSGTGVETHYRMVGLTPKTIDQTGAAVTTEPDVFVGHPSSGPMPWLADATASSALQPEANASEIRLAVVSNGLTLWIATYAREN